MSKSECLIFSRKSLLCSLICNDGAERRKWSPYVYWSQKRCHFLLSATLVKCATKNSHYYWLHGEEIWIKCTENWLKFRSCRTSNSRFENRTFTLWTYKVIELNFIQRSSRWDAMKALVGDAPFWWIGLWKSKKVQPTMYVLPLESLNENDVRRHFWWYFLRSK